MTNYEKNKEKIKQFADLGMTFSVNKFTQEVDLCATAVCDQCLFINSCDAERFMWAYEEHQEPEVDWSKVPIDTKVWVKDVEDCKWFPRHFAKYENGIVYAWDSGNTSFTAEGFLVGWEYAKLAEDDQ